MYDARCCVRDLSHRHWNRGEFRHDSSDLSNLQEKECQGYFYLDVCLHARRRRDLGSVWAQYPEFPPRVHQFARLLHHDWDHCWLGLVRSIVRTWRPEVVGMPGARADAARFETAKVLFFLLCCSVFRGLEDSEEDESRRGCCSRLHL